MRRIGQWCVLALIFLVRPAAAPPSAEIVFFTSGKVMPIATHRIDGASIVITLRDGGEVVCDPRLIERIEPVEGPVAPPPPPAEIPRPALPAKPYAELVRSASERHGVDPRLVHAVITVESNYRADARSPQGAMGLMQLMPATAERYAVGDPFDPGANIEAGTRHLKFLLEEYGTTSALAAYNAGEGPVRKYQGVPPFRETRHYVSKIMELVDGTDDDE